MKTVSRSRSLSNPSKLDELMNKVYEMSYTQNTVMGIETGSSDKSV